MPYGWPPTHAPLLARGDSLSAGSKTRRLNGAIKSELFDPSPAFPSLIPRKHSFVRVTFADQFPPLRETLLMSNPNAIEKVSFTHEALILWLLENPHRALRDCAAFFGYSQSWLSQIIHSDAFQEQLHKRQDELAILTGLNIRAKLRGATDIALEGLTRKLEKTEDPEFLLDATDKLLHRMGYAPASARAVGTMNIQQNNTSITHNVVSASDLAEARALLSGGSRELPLAKPREYGEQELLEPALLPASVDAK